MGMIRYKDKVFVLSMSLKNFLFQLVISIQSKCGFKKRKISNPEKPRFLVVSTTGLGDSLWATPAIRLLKQRYPKGHITVFTSPIGNEIFQNNPWIDELLILKRSTFFSCLKLLPICYRKRFEIALMFHASQRAILPLVVLSGPQIVVGTKGINKGLDVLLTRGLDNRHVHEIERRLELVETLEAQSNNKDLELILTKKEHHQADSFLKEKNIASTSCLVGIHPGSKDPFKRWDQRHFISLGRRLVEAKQARILVMGDQKERLLITSITKNIPGAIAVYELPIRLVAALIKRCSLMITNDSGLMHIAYALKIPTFSLFAPTDAKRCGPYHIQHATYIQKNKTCFPCLQKKCRRPFCLEQISLEEAWSDVQRMLI